MDQKTYDDLASTIKNGKKVVYFEGRTAANIGDLNFIVRATGSTVKTLPSGETVTGATDAPTGELEGTLPTLPNTNSTVENAIVAEQSGTPIADGQLPDGKVTDGSGAPTDTGKAAGKAASDGK